MPEMTANQAQLEYALEENAGLIQQLTLRISTLRVNHYIEVTELKATIAQLEKFIQELNENAREQAEGRDRADEADDRN